MSGYIDVFSACQQDETLTKQNNSQEELSIAIDNHLGYLANELREKKQTFHNADLVRAIGRQYIVASYGEKSDALNMYSRSFASTSERTARLTEVRLSKASRDYLTNIKEGRNDVKTLKEYMVYLSIIDRRIVNSNVPNDEKDILRAQILSMPVTLGFVSNNFDLFLSDSEQKMMRISWGEVGDGSDIEKLEDDPGWWESWGKCAAGTLGGTGLGSLGGTGLGSLGGARYRLGSSSSWNNSWGYYWRYTRCACWSSSVMLAVRNIIMSLIFNIGLLFWSATIFINKGILAGYLHWRFYASLFGFLTFLIFTTILLIKYLRIQSQN